MHSTQNDDDGEEVNSTSAASDDDDHVLDDECEVRCSAHTPLVANKHSHFKVVTNCAALVLCASCCDVRMSTTQKVQGVWYLCDVFQYCRH